MRKQILIAIVSSFFLLAPAIGQQQEKRQDEVVRVTTNLVQVDVVVTDKEGRHITDLGPEDFEILEDKRKQQITNFSYLAIGSATTTRQPATPTSGSERNTMPSVSPAALRPELLRRTMVIVVDDLGLSFESTISVRQALKKFVSEQMQPDDRIAIVRTSKGGGALQRFTSDKGQLLAAIERVHWYPAGRGSTSPFASLNETVDDIKQSAQLLEEVEEERAAIYAVGTLGTLSFVVRGLGELPGRKAIVLISEGFRLFTVQGRNQRLVSALRQLTDQANRASTVIYTLDASGLQTLNLTAADKVSGATFLLDPGLLGLAPGPPPRTVERADARPPRVDAAADAERDSGTAFRRLNALMDQRRDQNNEAQSVLSYIARQTGGFSVTNRNDLSAGLQSFFDDQKGYYLLGYRPAESTVGLAPGRQRFHALTVKVKRPGLQLRAREGFYGVSDEDRQLAGGTRDQRLAASLTSPFASGDIHLRLTSLFGNQATAGSFMRSLLHVDARDLSFIEEADGTHKAEMEVVAVNFGENGRIVDQYTYAQSIRVPRDEYERLVQQGLIYVVDVPVKLAGAYQLRVAVRDTASERIGTVSQFIAIPNLSKNRLALSGIVLSGIDLATTNKRSNSTPASPLSVNATPAPQGASSATQTADEPDPQAGAAVRRLRQGMLLEYRYFIYNAQPDSGNARPQLQTQVRLFRDGQPVFTGKLQSLDASKQTDLKRVSAVGRLRIGPELTPGEYVLQVLVTDLLAQEKRRTATQWMDFEIVK